MAKAKGGENSKKVWIDGLLLFFFLIQSIESF